MFGTTAQACSEQGRQAARSRRLRAVGRTSVALALLLALCAGCAQSARPAGPTSSTQTAGFFQRYLSTDGRIVRTDQGGDTVSEGQAYGLLLALADRDSSRFGLIWSWTRTHLQRPDHLLAYLWRDGAVTDDNPAPDADLDAASALLRAATVFGVPAYRTAGIEIANSVLTYETVSASPGILVTAGTWAVADPAVLNPSYLVAGEAQYLAQATGNATWNDVAAATSALDRSLAATGSLPPDWATLHSGASASGTQATGSPDGSTAEQYGLDAPRLIIRLATSCSSADRALAAVYATRLGATGAVGERTLAGAPLVTWRNPVTDIALYAARTAAGDQAGAAAALRAAAAQDTAFPTYYGKAWLALAPALYGPLKESC